MSKFKFKDILSDVSTLREFLRLLSSFMNKNCQGMPGVHLDLMAIRSQLKIYGVNDDAIAKIMAALVDLVISFNMLFSDMHRMGCIWNASIKDRIDDSDLLADEGMFNSRFQYSYHLSCFVLRYRSLWDKLFHAMFLMFQPENYKSLKNAKRKSRYFITNFKRIEKPDRQELGRYLQEFEETFRTPEMHRDGKIRKWVFDSVSLDNTPAVELIGYWNYLNEMIKYLNRFILEDSWDSYNELYNKYIKEK